MERIDAEEAAPIVTRMMSQLALTIPPSGRPGSDARTAIGDIKANVYAWLRADTLGPPLNNVLILVKKAGATYPAIEAVRRSVDAEQPVTLGATLIKNVCVGLCLATISEIMADTIFISRIDVDRLRKSLVPPFESSIEIAADDMDQASYADLTALYGALVNHMVATARPLPRLLHYEFAAILSTLGISYRLYSDAGRADEVRNENKVVHPAFCQRQGVALSQ